MRRIAELLVWLLPASRVKNRWLARFGRQVAVSAHIGPTLLVGVRDVRIGEGVRIAAGNVFRGLSTLRMEDESEYGSWNWTSAHPIFQELDPDAGTMFLGYRARVGSRCYVDASGSVIVRAYASVGGNRCLLQSHEPDFRTMEQTVGRIVIGHHSLVASQATLLAGARLPDQSTLAASATMGAARPDVEMRSGLYVGNPARWKAELDQSWMTRPARDLADRRIADVQGILPEDIWVDRSTSPET